MIKCELGCYTDTFLSFKQSKIKAIAKRANTADYFLLVQL